MSEFEPSPHPVIQPATLDDLEGYRTVQAQGWLDTYPNEAAGVSLEWVKSRAEGWLTPEALESSRERVTPILDDPVHQPLYVAKLDDRIIGMVHATNLEETGQHLDALYVDKNYHGQGIAQQLVDQVFTHFDLSQPVILGVVSYNQRAIRFYEKNGFEVIPGSEHLFRDVMPSINMIRQGEK